jgi:hypothetical protein
MRLVHNALMVLQWTALLGGLGFGGYSLFTGELQHALLSMMLSFLALIALKLEVLAFAR